jgi:hypothetical protein
MIIGRRKTEDGKTMEWLPPSALLMLMSVAATWRKAARARPQPSARRTRRARRCGSRVISVPGCSSAL